MPLRLPTINLPVSVTYPKLVVPLTFGTICVFFFMCRMSQYQLFRGGCFSGFWRRFFSRSKDAKLAENIEEEDVDDDEQLGPAESKIRTLQETIYSLEVKLQEQGDFNKKLKVLLDEQISETDLAVQRQKEEKFAKQEALTRLSEQISLKLADNNPNIADLSDANRPTNLADKFSMLYDDEWTEAFDALQNIPEFQRDEQAIKQLLEILMVCYTICRDQSARQMTSMFSINDLRIPDDQIPVEMRKLIKDKRKKYAGIYLHCLYDTIIASLKKQCHILPDDNAVEAYIKRCTELCWLMAVQDPPMAILTEGSKDGKFDKTKFKEYTKTGPYVDFIVWPAVLIQEGGDMMAKGVVQCKDKVVVADAELETGKALTIYERSTKEMKEVFDKETADMELQNKQSATTASGEETKYKLESRESNEIDLQEKEKVNAMSAIETVEPKQEDGNMMTKGATQCKDRAIKLNGEYQTEKIETNNGSYTQEKKGVNENETADNAFQNDPSSTADMELQNKQSATTVSGEETKYKLESSESNETDLQEKEKVNAMSAIETVEPKQEDGNMMTKGATQCNDRAIKLYGEYQTDKIETDNGSSTLEKKGVNENETADNVFKNEPSTTSISTVKEKLQSKEFESKEAALQQTQDMKAYSAIENNNEQSDNHEPRKPRQDKQDSHVQVGYEICVSKDNGNREMNDPQDHANDSSGKTNKTQETENLTATENDTESSLTDPKFDQTYATNNDISKTDTLNRDEVHVAEKEYKVSEGIQDPVSTDNGNYDMNDIQDHANDSNGETNGTPEAENLKETKNDDGASLTETNTDNINQIEEANIGSGKSDTLDHDQTSENNNKSEEVLNAAESGGKVTDDSGLTSLTEDIKTPTNASKDSTTELTDEEQLSKSNGNDNSEGISDTISATDMNDDLIAKRTTLSSDEPNTEMKSFVEAGDETIFETKTTDSNEALLDTTGKLDIVSEVTEDRRNETGILNQSTTEITESVAEISADNKAVNNEANNTSTPASTNVNTIKDDDHFETESSHSETGETKCVGDKLIQDEEHK